MYYPVDYSAEQLVRDGLDRRCHSVARVDGADYYRPFEAAQAFLYADGLVVRNESEVLPDPALKPRVREFFAEDRVGFSDGFEPVARDGAEAAYSETGAGERLTVYHVVGQTESVSYHPDLILEEELQRLNELESEILGQTAHVMVCFYGTGFEYIGIYGALRQEFDTVELSRLFLEDSDEFGSDYLSLFFRLGNTDELVKKPVYRVDIDQIRPELITEDSYNLFRLTLAEKTVIDVYADEAVADRFDKQSRDDRAVNAAGQREQDLAVFYLFTKS